VWTSSCVACCCKLRFGRFEVIATKESNLTKHTGYLFGRIWNKKKANIYVSWLGKQSIIEMVGYKSQLVLETPI
jgi:hypothetical protein